jgi:hypothetical protein
MCLLACLCGAFLYSLSLQGEARCCEHAGSHHGRPRGEGDGGGDRIGNIEAELRGLSASVADVRQSSAEYHPETRASLESISGRVAKIEADMKPLAKTVATMEPIVAGYAVTR